VSESVEDRRYRKIGARASRIIYAALIIGSAAAVGREFGVGVGLSVGFALLALNGIHDELIRLREKED
jgi:uncharacterized membrane protein